MTRPVSRKAKDAATAAIRERIPGPQTIQQTQASRVGGSRYLWRVNSLRTNKGYYNCQRVTFDSTDFDTGNTDPRDYTGNNDVVFNIYEGGTTTTHALAVGDFLNGLRTTDDEGKDIFIGWPMAPIIKRATTQAAAGTGLTLSVKLQTPSGSTPGNAFNVTFLAPDGATNLNSCLPRIANNKTILISKIDGTWYAVYPTIIKSSVCV